MTKSDGVCKVDGVAMGEVTINLLAEAPIVTAKYALCNTATGGRFGAGTRYGNYSKETVEKMQAFLASLELDVVHDLFAGGTTTSSGEAVEDYQPDGVPGL